MPFDLAFVKKHPLEIGALAVVSVGVLFLLLRGSGGSSQSSDNSDASAYYAAQSAQAQAGDALAAVQIQTQGATAQDLINAQASVTNNNTWASTDLAETQSNNATAVQLAPYAVQNNLVSTLGGVASQTSTTTSSVSQGGTSGFFGIGATPATSSSSSVTAPTASAEEASDELSSLLSSGFFASS